jgi:hypothetical protein
MLNRFEQDDAGCAILVPVRPFCTLRKSAIIKKGQATRLM